MSNTNQNIRYYIYLDKEGIDSLYRQYTDAQNPSKETTTNRAEGSVESSIGGNQSLFSLLPWGVKAKARLDGEIKKEYVIDISYESKVKFIQEKECAGRTERLCDIIDRNPKINKLIACEAIFRLEKAFDNETNRYISPFEISRNPFSYKDLLFNFCSTPLVREIPDVYNLLGVSYSSDEYYVDMCFSGSKMVRGVRHITNQIKYGKDFRFHILGEISHEGGKIYCLKPYAIWRTSDTN